MSDINYFSIGRTPQEIADNKPNTYTVDVGLPSQHNVDELPSDLKFDPDNPSIYNDILKFSGAANVSLLNGVVVAQGKEDSVDMNRFCTNITLQGDFGMGNVQGNSAFTIKGGSKDIQLFGTIHNRNKETDVDIGNWSDQTYDESTNISVHVNHADGKPVRVRIGRASNITLGENCKEDKFGSLQLKAYWWFKWLVRKILGIKVGQSGPSWL